MKERFYVLFFISLILTMFIYIIGCGSSATPFTVGTKTIISPPAAPFKGEILNVKTETIEITFMVTDEVIDIFNVYLNTSIYKTNPEDQFSITLKDLQSTSNPLIKTFNNGTLEKTVDGKKIYYTLKNLKKNNAYNIKVTSINVTDEEIKESIQYTNFNLTTMIEESAPKTTSSLSVIQTTLNSALINFTPSLNTFKYILFIDNSPYTLNGQPVYFYSPGTFEILNLNSNSTYDFNLKAINGYNSDTALIFESSNASETTTVITGSIPATPSQPEASSILDTSFSLSWTSVPYTTKYLIYKYKKNTVLTDTDGLFKTVSGDINSTTVDSLEKGETYEVKIRAENKYGLSDFSPTLEVTTKDIPSVPSNIYATETTLTYTINWDGSNTADRYKVYKNGIYFSATENTTFTFTLDTFETYTLEVSSENIFGESEKSTPHIALPISSKPYIDITDTTFFTQQGDYSTKIMLSWDPVPNTSHYEIFLDNSPYIHTFDPVIVITDLTPGTSYTIGLQAKNSEGSSGKITTTVTTSVNPEPVTFLTLDAQNQDYFKISWQKAEGATSYYVSCVDSVGTVMEFKDDYLANISDRTKAETENTWFEFSNDTNTTLRSGFSLDPGKDYTVTVKSQHNSNESTAETITVEIPGIPSPVVSVLQSNITKNSINLSWTDPNSPVTELYYIYINGIKTFSDITNTTKKIENLNVNTDYTISISAVELTDNGEVLESTKTSTSFKTLAPELTNPKNISYFNLNNTSINIVWDPVAYAEKYSIASPNIIISSVANSTVAGASFEISTNSCDITTATPIIDGTIFRIYAINSNTNNTISSSDLVISSVVNAAPASGTTLYSNAYKSTEKMTITWDDVPSATNYLISLEEDVTGYTIINKLIPNNTIDNYEFLGLTHDTYYTAEVKAVHPTGESLPLYIPFKTNEKPEDFSITSVVSTTKEITINWDMVGVSSETTETFTIYIKPSSVSEFSTSPTKTIVSTGVDLYSEIVNQFTVNEINYALTDDTSYDIKMYGLNNYDTTAAKTKSTRTDYVPHKPYNVAVTVDSEGLEYTGLDYIKIQWETEDQSPKPDHFIISWDTDEVLPFTGQYTTSDSIYHAYTITGLTENTEYNIWVTAVNPTASSSKTSEKLTASTQSPPSAVTFRDITDITSDSLLVQWNAITDADFYNLEVHNKSDDSNIPTLEQTGIEINIDSAAVNGLAPHHDYIIYVISVKDIPGETDLEVEATFEVRTKNVIDFNGDTRNEGGTFGIVDNTTYPYLPFATINVLDNLNDMYFTTNNNAGVFKIGGSDNYASLISLYTLSATSEVCSIDGLSIGTPYSNAGIAFTRFANGNDFDGDKLYILNRCQEDSVSPGDSKLRVYPTGGDLSGPDILGHDDFEANVGGVSTDNSLYAVKILGTKAYYLTDNSLCSVTDIEDPINLAPADTMVENLNYTFTSNPKHFAFDGDNHLIISDTINKTLHFFEFNDAAANGEQYSTSHSTLDLSGTLLGATEAPYGICAFETAGIKKLLVACGPRLLILEEDAAYTYKLDSGISYIALSSNSSPETTYSLTHTNPDNGGNLGSDFTTMLTAFATDIVKIIPAEAGSPNTFGVFDNSFGKVRVLILEEY